MTTVKLRLISMVSGVLPIMFFIIFLSLYPKSTERPAVIGTSIYILLVILAAFISSLLAHKIGRRIIVWFPLTLIFYGIPAIIISFLESKILNLNIKKLKREAEKNLKSVKILNAMFVKWILQFLQLFIKFRQMIKIF